MLNLVAPCLASGHMMMRCEFWRAGQPYFYANSAWQPQPAEPLSWTGSALCPQCSSATIPHSRHLWGVSYYFSFFSQLKACLLSEAHWVANHWNLHSSLLDPTILPFFIPERPASCGQCQHLFPMWIVVSLTDNDYSGLWVAGCLGTVKWIPGNNFPCDPTQVGTPEAGYFQNWGLTFTPWLWKQLGLADSWNFLKTSFLLSQFQVLGFPFNDTNFFSNYSPLVSFLHVAHAKPKFKFFKFL